MKLGYGVAGRYGSATDYYDATADDFCRDGDGAEITAATSGGGPHFATFMLLDSIEGSCDDGSTLTTDRGSGIMRNTDTHALEIYGQFEIGGSIVNCTIRLDGDVDSPSSSCTDSASAAVSLSSHVACSMDPSVARKSLPPVMKGHFAVTSDAGQDISHDCHDTSAAGPDSDGFVSLTSDCSGFNSYGFNLDGVDLSFIVSGSEAGWTIHQNFDLDDVVNRIKLMRVNGYPIMAFIDLQYVPDYDGTVASVEDGIDFPEALIDNSDFTDELTQTLMTLASTLENLNVELLSPLSEPDRIFSQSARGDAASSYLQGILGDITSRYTGKLIWVAANFDGLYTSTYDLDGFDYAGLDLSPTPSDDPGDFATRAQTQLAGMKSVADNLGLPYLIVKAGLWGEALTSSTYDWDLTSYRVVSAFSTMQDESRNYSADGIIFWEGAAGEVTIGDYPDLSRYIASQFGGVTDSFATATDSATDGEYDLTLTGPALSWDLLTGPLFVAKGMTMVAYGGKLYVFGGSSEWAGEETQIYDISLDSWSTGADMPRYRESAVAAELNGLIYVIGGTDPDTCGGDYRCGQMGNVDVYNPTNNSWSTAASLNERRDVSGAVVYGDRIYLVGGMYSELGDTSVSNRNSIERYDPDADTWTIIDTDIPYPVRSAATTLVGHEIFVIGGCSEKDANLIDLEAENTCQQTLVQVYDIEKGIWDIMNDNMPTGRLFSGQHAVATGYWILVYGGATDLSAITYDVVEAYNLSGKTWAASTSMQVPRKSSASAVYNGYLYVTGGTDAGVSESLANGMERAYIGGL